jgi:hypothetical protein
VTLCTELSATLISRATELARHRKRYHEGRAKMNWDSIRDALTERPELLRSVQRLYQAIKNDPTSLAHGSTRFVSLGRIPKRTRKKDG